MKQYATVPIEYGLR